MKYFQMLANLDQGLLITVLKEGVTWDEKMDSGIHCALIDPNLDFHILVVTN